MFQNYSRFAGPLFNTPVICTLHEWCKCRLPVIKLTDCFLNVLQILRHTRKKARRPLLRAFGGCILKKAVAVCHHVLILSHCEDDKRQQVCAVTKHNTRQNADVCVCIIQSLFCSFHREKCLSLSSFFIVRIVFRVCISSVILMQKQLLVVVIIVIIIIIPQRMDHWYTLTLAWPTEMIWTVNGQRWLTPSSRGNSAATSPLPR